MHSSWFKILDGSEVSKELALPGDASEWLFYVGFWSELGASVGRHFEQYEEEVLPPSGLELAVANIGRLLTKVQVLPDVAVRFVYATDANNEPICCDTTNAALAPALSALKDLLLDANRSGGGIFCQL